MFAVNLNLSLQSSVLSLASSVALIKSSPRCGMTPGDPPRAGSLGAGRHAQVPQRCCTVAGHKLLQTG